MLELNKKNARMLSMLGQRGSIFAIALPDLADHQPSIRVLAADSAELSGLSKFKANHSEKFMNFGIAEQNMIGVAAGLAKEGNCVFATTYATFLSMRSFEQIRNNLGYMKFNVKAVGSSAGLAMGMLGNTHYAIEDLALMRSIPNLTILSPADSGEALKMAYAAASSDGPFYIRLTDGLNCPIVYTYEYDLKIGQAIKLKDGKDLAIIATGSMVSQALKVSELLDQQQIRAAVFNMHTIKPLDTDILNIIFSSYRVAVTIEEHSRIGGLGSAVAEYTASLKTSTRLKIFGLPDSFFRADERDFLLEQLGLSATTLSCQITEFYNQSINSD